MKFILGLRALLMAPHFRDEVSNCLLLAEIHRPRDDQNFNLWRARQESNLYLKLRRLLFYPLKYGRRVDIVACLAQVFFCSKFIWFFVAEK